MRIRSVTLAYALVLVILLFADRRPGSSPQDRYSYVVVLTEGQTAPALRTVVPDSPPRIIASGAHIPGTWSPGPLPPARLVAPLLVMDLNANFKGTAAGDPQISLDDIAAWETQHGMIPQGAVIAIRRNAAKALSTNDLSNATSSFPIARDAAEFLIDARYTIGFAVETPVDLTSDRKFDRTLARQLALHGSYIVEGAARFTSLPATGSLIIVAPVKNKKPGEAPVRVLAMVH